MTFGTKLQALRTDAALSQEDLAARLGVSRQAVSKWELDKTTPDASYIVAISDLFQVSTDYLLKNGPSASPRAAVPPSPLPEAKAVSDEPGRAKAACVLLGCGNILFLTLLLFSLCKFVFLRADSFLPPAFILVTAPVLIAVGQGLLWKGPLSPDLLRRWRRATASAVVLMGFAAALLLGYHEVVDDLLVSRVEGLLSLPLLLGMTTALLLIFWCLGCFLAHRLILALKTA